jgi:predicted transporter
MSNPAPVCFVAVALSIACCASAWAQDNQIGAVKRVTAVRVANGTITIDGHLD